MTIAILRANHVAPEPRVERSAASLSRKFGHVVVFGWDRERVLPCRETRSIDGQEIEIRRCRIPGRYGAGISNLGGLVAFQGYLVRSLFALRHELTAIHACDFSTALAGAVMARVLHVPLIYDIFDYYVDSFPVPKALRGLVRCCDHAVIERADCVIVVSEARLGQLDGTSPKRVCVLHNSPGSAPDVGKSGSREVRGSSKRSKRLVYVGVLTGVRLLEEILEIVRHHPDWELHIGGFGPLESVISAAGEAHRNVHFHGRLSYDDTLALEETADVLFAVYDPTVPNHRLSAPNKFYEALMLGKPLIVAKGTGVDELVERFDVGEVIDFSGEAFESAVENLFSDQSRIECIAHIGPSVFDEYFSWEIMEARLFEVYAAVVCRR